jgi:hypothetical protein
MNDQCFFQWFSFLLTAAGQSRVFTGFPLNFNSKTGSIINIRGCEALCQQLIVVQWAMPPA